ncbi:hypothetical protein [Clostridium oceanicum]|uniref:Lipoprotein n=1 Tax=Clostridium oceanicum TaxID=1543 RepID=A0ABN1JE88_9CLOT
MKINKYSTIKKIASILTMFIVVTTFFGCSKVKSVVLQSNVKKANKSFEGNIKVNEDFIYIPKNKNEMCFEPSFWQNGKLFGTLTKSSIRDKELSIIIDKYIPKYFHALDINKKLLNETKKKAFAASHYGLKEISRLSFEKGNFYYNDFSKEKSQQILLGKVSDLEDLSNDSPKNIPFGDEYIVDGNDKFATFYRYTKIIKNNICTGTVGFIRLLDLETKKLYKNDNIGDIEIIKVLYVKDLKKFMAIDKKGICYEIKFKGNSLKLEKFSQIDTGDLTLQQPCNGVAGRCNGSEIYFMSKNDIGKNKLIKNRLIKYNFKTKKTDFILNMDENDKTRVLDYFPKQNILILEKTDIPKEGVLKGPSEIYLAEIKNGKANIFYKSKYKNEEKKYSKSLFEKLNTSGKEVSKNYIKSNDLCMYATINDKGDKLAIIRNINILKKYVPEEHIKGQVIDYYDIKRK